MLTYDEDDPELQVIADAIREEDERRRLEYARQTNELMGDNAIVARTRGCRIAYRRDDGRFLEVTMRFSYPADGPLPPDGAGQNAWDGIHAFAIGWLKAAGLEGRTGRA